MPLPALARLEAQVLRTGFEFDWALRFWRSTLSCQHWMILATRDQENASIPLEVPTGNQ
jgi:hypothetical protein